MIPEELPLSPIVEANVQRWGADDDGWRGYHRTGERVVPDDRVACALRLALPSPGASLADLGCANGVLTRLLAEKVQAKRVVGVDFVDMGIGEGVEFARANLDSNEPLPFADATFSVVTCLETLEHLHDTDHVLSEIRRILRPDGYAIIGVPRLDALLSILMLAAGLQPPAIECSLRRRYGAPDPGSRVSGHVSHFTRRGLEEFVHANGFTIEASAQASIYSAWRHASVPPPLWQRLPMWALSKLPVKRDNLILRIRPAGR